MSDMHVQEGNNGLYQVVMHIPVPGGNNDVGEAWSATILRMAGVDDAGVNIVPGTVLRSGDILQSEVDAIKAGTVFEYVGNFLIESNGISNEELKGSLRGFYGQTKTRLINSMQADLNYSGHTESEV